MHQPFILNLTVDNFINSFYQDRAIVLQQTTSDFIAHVATTVNTVVLKYKEREIVALLNNTQVSVNSALNLTLKDFIQKILDVNYDVFMKDILNYTEDVTNELASNPLHSINMVIYNNQMKINLPTSYSLTFFKLNHVVRFLTNQITRMELLSARYETVKSYHSGVEIKNIMTTFDLSLDFVRTQPSTYISMDIFGLMAKDIMHLSNMTLKQYNYLYRLIFKDIEVLSDGNLIYELTSKALEMIHSKDPAVKMYGATMDEMKETLAPQELKDYSLLENIATFIMKNQSDALQYATKFQYFVADYDSKNKTVFESVVELVKMKDYVTTLDFDYSWTNETSVKEYMQELYKGK